MGIGATDVSTLHKFKHFPLSSRYQIWGRPEDNPRCVHLALAALKCSDVVKKELTELEQMRALVVLLESKAKTRDAEIAELRAHCHTLTKSRKRYEALVENLNQSVLWFDSHLEMVRFNKQTARIHGFNPVDLAKAKTFEEYALLLAKQGDLGTGEPHHLAILHAEDMLARLRRHLTVKVHLKAQERHLRARYTELPDASFVITHVDITSEVQSEQQFIDANRMAEHSTKLLERQRNDLQTVLDNLKQSIMWYDKEGKLILRNQQAGVLHAMDEAQLTNVNSFRDHLAVLAARGDLGEGSVDELIETSWQRIFDPLEDNKTYRKYFPHSDRHLSITVASTPKGGRVLSEIDITDQVKAEEELDRTLKLLEDANHALEDKVEERTRELRELQSSLLKAERDATMSQLIAKLSHELRNPLNALSTSLYIIRSKVGEDEKLTKAFDRSERTIKRCTRILSDLYDFAMTQQLKRNPVSISEWLDENTSNIDLPDDITLEYKNELGDTVLNIDRKPMTKAVWKVVHNAILSLNETMAGEGGKRLAFKAYQTGDRVYIDVSDNGPGMPEEIRQKALEPLFSTRGFGVGLGLPIAQQMFEQHGGGLELDTSHGNGTTVRLWLPIEDNIEQAA